MTKTKLALAAALALAAMQSFAQTAPAAAPAPEAKPDWTITGNASLYSDYRFRGFTQTAYRPAFQGGFDIAHSSGFYVGNWNSNVEQALYRGATLEMDVYGGYKFDVGGGVGLDLGGYYYAYPTKADTKGLGQAKQGEVYVGASFAFLTAKFSYGLTNFFGLGDGTPFDTKGNYYLDLGASYDLGGGWGVNGHYGYQYIKHGTDLGLSKNDVSDYRIGGTKDLSGWVFGASIVGTSKKEFFTTGATFPEGAGKTSLVVNVTKAF
jgi:uncharacterized protein (TIGR02001 family)